MEFSGKLEIQLHSGKRLKDVKHFGIMSPYARIYVTLDGQKTEHVTNIAKKGDSDPVWDCSMVFNNVSTNKNDNLVIKINHCGTCFDRRIGTVEVPFKDLLEGDASGDKLSYPVTTQAGSTQGEILLSHRFTNVVMRSINEGDTISIYSSSSGSNSSTSTNTNTNTSNLDPDESGKKDDGKEKTNTSNLDPDESGKKDDEEEKINTSNLDPDESGKEDDDGEENTNTSNLDPDESGKEDDDGEENTNTSNLDPDESGKEDDDGEEKPNTRNLDSDESGKKDDGKAKPNTRNLDSDESGKKYDGKAKPNTRNLDSDESGKKDDGIAKTLTKEAVKVVGVGVSIGAKLVGKVFGESNTD